MSIIDKVLGKVTNDPKSNQNPKLTLDTAKKCMTETERLFASASVIDRAELAEIGSITTEINNLSLRISTDRANGTDTSDLEREADKLETKLAALKTKNARSSKATSIADDNRTKARRDLDAARKNYARHHYLELINEGISVMGPGVTKLREALQWWTDHQTDLQHGRMQEMAIPMLSREGGIFDSVREAVEREISAPTKAEANAARKVPSGHRRVKFIKAVTVSGNPITIGSASGMGVGEVASYPAAQCKHLVDGGWAEYVDGTEHRDEARPASAAPETDRKQIAPVSGTMVVKFVRSTGSDGTFSALGYQTGDRATLPSSTAAAVIAAGIAEAAA